MGVAYFVRNALIEFEGKEYLLFRALRDGSVWQLENTKDHSIIERELSALYRALAKRKLRFIPSDTPKGTITKIQLSEDELVLIKVRRQYVLAVAHIPNTQTMMEEVIDSVWQKIHLPERKPSWTTVYRWKTVYFRSNEDGRALLDGHSGKPWKEELYGSIVLGICDVAIEERYMVLERGTIQDTLDLAKERVIVEQRLLDVAFENGDIPKSLRLKSPTWKLIRRLVDMLPKFDKCAARFGLATATMKFRSVKGKDFASEPLEQFELDHTKLDLFVVDDETGLPCGRPYITACIDNFTRCVMGIYIGFVAPSGLSVALCLKDAFFPKDWRELYPEIVNELPFGICRRLKVDNGLEFHGSQVEQICVGVGITIDYTPRKRAWYKGKIERLFRTLNQQLLHGTPGTTFSNVIEKGDYNPERFATVSLSALRKNVRKWVPDVYHQKEHRVLGMSPMQMWQNNIRPDLLRVPSDPTILDAVMGRPFSRTLSHKGVQYDNLFYNSEDFKKLRYREGEELLVTISVDEENLGRIWILWNNCEIFEGQALEFEYANGLSSYQHKKIQEYRKLHKLPNNEAGWLQAKEEIRQAFIDEFKLTAQRRRETARYADSGEKVPTKKPSQSVGDDGVPSTNTSTSATTQTVKHFDPIVVEKRRA